MRTRAVRQDGVMTLAITVRGSAQQRHPAERAIVTMAVAVEGSTKQDVFGDAMALQEKLSGQLEELVDRDAVRSWSIGQVRVFRHRPVEIEGDRGAMLHIGKADVHVEFIDFEGLSSFLDQWSGIDGVEIIDVGWDVSARNRRIHEAEVRKAAVDNAVAKAQAYAEAVRRGRVVAVQIADPGMLDGLADGPAARHPAGSGGDVGPGLTITPEEIVIHIEVDAKFIAD